MATFEKMWNEIDIGHRARREVLMLRDKLQESESLVATTTEAVSAEAHKLRDQLEGSSQLLAEARKDLQLQRSLVEKRWVEAELFVGELAATREEGKKALENLRAQLTIEHEKKIEEAHEEF